jgi:hypothetical protein
MNDTMNVSVSEVVIRYLSEMAELGNDEIKAEILELTLVGARI